jgi:hypothetical protein
VIVDVLLLLFAAGGLFFLRTVAQAAVQMRQDMAATRKQAKEALREVQRTRGHADRILERAYYHQQQINVLMENENVKAAIRHAKES